MSDETKRRRLPPWLPFAGAALGVTIVAVRLATLPFEQYGPFLIGLLVAVGATIAIFAGVAILRRTRMRAAALAHPNSLLIPIVVGAETAAASRWLAAQLEDAGLRLRAEQLAILAVDAAGLRVLGGATTSAALPPSRLTVLPLATTRVGARRVDALVIGVAVGDAVAPVPLVPVRSTVFALGTLTDAELLDVSARLTAALAGEPTAPGWQY